MPCLGRNRRAKSKDRQSASENKENEHRNLLRRVWKRVSAISSVIIKFLRDIRDGILRLFGFRGRATSKTSTKYFPVKIEEKNEGAKLFEFSTPPRSFEWNRKENNEFVTEPQIHRPDRSEWLIDRDIDTLSIKVQIDDEDEWSEFHRIQDFEPSASCACKDPLPAGATGGPSQSPSQVVPEQVKNNNPELDLLNRFYRFFKKIDSYAFQTEQDKILKHIFGVIDFIESTETSCDRQAKCETLREQCRRAFEKRKVELQSQQRATFQVDENGVVRFTASPNGPLQPKIKPHKALEARRKHRMKANTTKITPPSTQAEKQAACQEQVNNTPQKSNDEVDPSDDSVVAAKIRKSDGMEKAKPKSKPKASLGAALKEKFTRSTKTTPKTGTATKQKPAPSTPGQVPGEVVVLEKETKVVPLTNASQLEANEVRFIRIMNKVVQYCIGAFKLEHWTYRMELTVHLHLGPNGENYWNPRFTDSLYEPNPMSYISNVSQTRSTRFVRLISLESYVGFVGMSPTAEEVLTTLETITTKNSIFERSESGEETLITLESIGELHWCSELLDVMSYISYYAMIGCSKIMKKIHANDKEIDQKRILANVLHDHVVQKFDHSLQCIIPRMRHAVANFCLEYEAIESPTNGAGARPKVPQAVQAMAPLQTQPEAPVGTPKKHGKKKNRHTKATHKRSKSRHKASGAGDSEETGEKGVNKNDACTIPDDLRCNGDLESGDTAVTTTDETNDPENKASEQYGPQNAVDTAEINAEIQNAVKDGTDVQVLDNMNKVLAADINRFVEWDFADYVNYIETNNTLDYGCHEVIAGHGERPNKKKLAGEIKEKKKTKGIPNKHLEQANQSHDFTVFEDDALEASGTDGDSTETQQAELDDSIIEPEHVEKEEILNQTIDDREFNMVPEEVIRKDDTKLKDLEEAYTIVGSEKKKDKHKKKKERKQKAVKVQLDIEFSDYKHR